VVRLRHLDSSHLFYVNLIQIFGFRQVGVGIVVAFGNCGLLLVPFVFVSLFELLLFVLLDLLLLALLLSGPVVVAAVILVIVVPS
jgi:hypothetical protein